MIQKIELNLIKLTIELRANNGRRKNEDKKKWKHEFPIGNNIFNLQEMEKGTHSNLSGISNRRILTHVNAGSVFVNIIRSSQ